MSCLLDICQHFTRSTPSYTGKSRHQQMYKICSELWITLTPGVFIIILDSTSCFENIRSFDKLSIDKVYKEQLDSVFYGERTCSCSFIRGYGCHWQQ